jgi:N-formylglutamate deformylase
MSLEIAYQITTMDSPFWSFAIHDGHTVSEELMPYVNGQHC